MVAKAVKKEFNINKIDIDKIDLIDKIAKSRYDSIFEHIEFPDTETEVIPATPAPKPLTKPQTTQVETQE